MNGSKVVYKENICRLCSSIGPSLMEGEAPMAKGINVVLECQLTKLSINTTTTTSGELLPPKHSCKYVGFLLKIINKQ
jgi:hypothetical protein